MTLTNFFIALILLGIGWNFGFVGATSLLASSTCDRTNADGLKA